MQYSFETFDYSEVLRIVNLRQKVNNNPKSVNGKRSERNRIRKIIWILWQVATILTDGKNINWQEVIIMVEEKYKLSTSNEKQ